METFTEIKPGLTATGTRMVVFVPERLERTADFARQVYLLALVQQREVVYLAVNTDESDPLAASRDLATLTALTGDASVRARSLQVNAQDWVDALRQVTRPGDVVVWPEARLVAPAGLAAELAVHQHVLPGEFAAPHRPDWSPVLFWLGALVLLAGFSWLELVLWGRMSSDFWKKIALIGLFLVEMSGVYGWNRFFVLRQQ